MSDSRTTWGGGEEGSEMAESTTEISERKHNKRKREQKRGVGHEDSGCGKMKEAGRMDGGSEEEEGECKK